MVTTLYQQQSGTGLKKAGASRFQYRDDFLTDCDAWMLALMMLNLPGTLESMPLEQLISKASSVRASTTRFDGGSSGLRIELRFDKSARVRDEWQVEIDLDPQFNYLIRRSVYTKLGGTQKLVRDDRVLAFRETSPSIYFPESVEFHAKIGDKDWYNKVVTLSEIHVNEPIPTNVFDMSFPNGVIMSDRIRNVTYYVDESGHRISEEKAVASVPPPPISKGETVADVPNPDAGRPTREEPRSWTRFIFPVSAGLLFIGALLLIVQRKRMARQIQ